MNKKIFLGTFVAFALVLTTLLTGSTAEAKQNNSTTYNGSENSMFPGNSLFGRMHNPHFMYKWGGQSFEDFDDLIDYIRQYILMRVGNHSGIDDSDAQVDVVTRSATNVDEDSATLRGRIVLDTDETADVWFTYGTTSSKLTSTTSEQALEYGDTQYFSSDIADLESGTRYYYRSVARDEDDELDYGTILYFTTNEDGTVEDTPIVTTRTPSNITDDSATLRGQVEMEDFENGIVFFVYGTDEDKINAVDNDFSTYAGITESGDALTKVQVDADLDDVASYNENVDGIDDSTKYFYRIGVQYEDEDGHDTLEMGNTRTFTTE